MKKQIFIVGLGRLGMTIATALSDMGYDILAIDNDEKTIQEASVFLNHAVKADATSETVLRDLGAGNFDLAIVTTGSDVEASVLATILLKKLGVPRVIARANSDLHGTILDKIGADKVVYPEKEMGFRIAREIEMEGISDYIALDEKYGVTKIIAPSGFAGEKLGEIGFGPGGRNGLTVLLIRRGEEVIVSPGADTMIKEGDALIVTGDIVRLGGIISDARKNGNRNG
jgi:trk system potassium uptake protein TrkA